MTQEEKRTIIQQWWVDNWSQLEINIWKVLGYSQAAHNKWGDDLLVWSYEQFTKKDIDKQYEIYEGGKLENYITRGMALGIKSSTSPFYHHYRKYSRRSAELNYESDYQGRVVYTPGEYDKLENNEAVIRKAVSSLDFYNRYLITEYYYGKSSIYELSSRLDINASRISKDIKKALHILKSIIENDIEL